MKCRAEVAQAVVANLQRGLGDVVLARLEQFRRTLHAQLAQMLRDGVAGLRGKNPAQIKMAAANFLAKFLQGRRLDEILFQQENHLFDAFLREPLLARTKHFLFRRRLEQKRDGQFQRLALIPQRLRGGIYRRLPERGDELLLRRREPDGRAGNEFARTFFNGRTHQRVQHRLHARQVFRQKRTGKFHRQKLVLLIRRTAGGQRLVLAMVKPDRAWREIRPLMFAFHEAVAVQIQTQLDAARMKTRGPVKFVPREKIVPLDAVARTVKTAEDRLPAFADIAPRVRLGERRGLTTKISGWSSGFQSGRNLLGAAELLFPRGDFLEQVGQALHGDHDALGLLVRLRGNAQPLLAVGNVVHHAGLGTDGHLVANF